MDPEKVRLCNCAECGRELLGVSSWSLILATANAIKPAQQRQALAGYPPVVAGRLSGRPYCAMCLAPRRRLKGNAPPTRDDANPGFDDAVRAMEEDR